MAKQGKQDEVVASRHKELQSIEDVLVGHVNPVIKSHPAWKWAKRVKGIGPENLAKVVGLIEKVERDGKFGIECFDTPSKVVRYCGFAVIDGKAEKRVIGEKLHYNSELRSMLWRLGNNLNMATGKFHQFYLGGKEYLEWRYQRDGARIIPTPTSKFCPECHVQVQVKTAKYCPDCDTRLAKKQEPEGVIFEGHLHNQALRRMIRMFIIQLYTAWREELGLPVRIPYPIEYKGHTRIFTPEDFVE